MVGASISLCISAGIPMHHTITYARAETGWRSHRVQEEADAHMDSHSRYWLLGFAPSIPSVCTLVDCWAMRQQARHCSHHTASFRTALDLEEVLNGEINRYRGSLDSAGSSVYDGGRGRGGGEEVFRPVSICAFSLYPFPVITPGTDIHVVVPADTIFIHC